jgi:hypothetical protein
VRPEFPQNEGFWGDKSAWIFENPRSHSVLIPQAAGPEGISSLLLNMTVKGETERLQATFEVDLQLSQAARSSSLTGGILETSRRYAGPYTLCESRGRLWIQIDGVMVLQVPVWLLVSVSPSCSARAVFRGHLRQDIDNIGLSACGGILGLSRRERVRAVEVWYCFRAVKKGECSSMGHQGTLVILRATYTLPPLPGMYPHCRVLRG